MEQSNKNIAFSDLKGLKKSSVKKSNPSFLSKLFGLTKKTVYEFQDDLYKLYGSDINKKWRGGIITTKDGKIFPNGKGYFYGEDGKKIEKEIKSFKLTNGNFYTGAWKDGKKEGEGKYTWLNCDYYEGKWSKGKLKDGRVKRTFADGYYHEGEWQDAWSEN